MDFERVLVQADVAGGDRQSCKCVRRMEEIASKSPGQYFVFSQATRSVVARTGTRESVSPSPESQSESV